MRNFIFKHTFTAAAALAALAVFPQTAARADDQPRKVANTTCLTPPAPSDADVLFDGTEKSVADAWDATRGPKNKVWPVKDGIMVASATDIRTKKAYGDCQFHIEWRIPADRHVNGQKGGNSGVIFMDGRYEVQILESYSNKTYADGMAGALYNKSVPLVNSSRPKGEWQSYDIAFTAPRFDESGKQTAPARFTVLFNGVVVQLNQDLSGTTRSRASKPQAHPQRLPIILQFHGDPIEFRNIWIRDLDKTPASPVK